MNPPNELLAEALLGFDGTVYRFDGGYEISLSIRRVDASDAFPHGFKYSFVLLGPGARGNAVKRILAYDNAHAPSDAKQPFDHLHRTRKGPGGAPIGVHQGIAISVKSIEELIGTFFSQCEAKLTELGVDWGSAAQTSETAEPTTSKKRNVSTERKRTN